MRLRRAIVSALLIVSMISGLQVLSVSAASRSSVSTSSTSTVPQGSALSTLETQLNQQGLNISALTNLLQQFSVSNGQASSDSAITKLINNIFSKSTSSPATASLAANNLLAKAQPDACFAVTSRDPNTQAVTGLSDSYPKPPQAFPGGVCPAGTQPKTDQAYVWGLTQSGSDLWFGTMANTQCQVEGSYLGTTTPSANADAACEFGLSPLVTNPPNLPAAVGDWRPPQVWVYNLGGSGLSNAATLPINLTTTLASDLNHTLGLRSAGSVGNYVLLAGPALAGGAVNVLVFTADTHAYQGMITLSQYDNVRKWLTYNGVLYTAMHDTAPALGGDVLKWTPNAGDLTSPGQFTVVGHVNGDPAELAVFNNQMFISTWPDPTALAQLTGALGGGTSGSVTPQSLSSQDLGSFGTILQQILQRLRSTGNSNPFNLPVAGLFMSPAFNGSLNASTATWKEPWNVLDYEPDPVTALTYGGGAISVYNGFLYWGTMHIPAVSTLYHLRVYGAGIAPNGLSDTNALLQVFENSERAISIFRGAYFGKQSQTVQLLYGEKTLPVWVPNSLTNIQGPGRWVNMNTKAGKPLFGSSGFGNPFNNYTWSMAVYNGSLYVGTMDWSMLAGQAAGSGIGVGLNVDPSLYGADLWKFTGFGPAVPVDTQGLGNPTNYGIRTMITAQDGSALYVGMANPMNLAQNQSGQPIGGWELRELK